MTGAAAAQVAATGTPEYLGAAVALALVTGVLLMAMGALRLGFLANFLSHPVISGFITAAAVQIAAGQVGPLLGVGSKGESLLDVFRSVVPNLAKTNPYTAAIGIGALVFLLWASRGLKPLLLGAGLPERPANIVAKVAPAIAPFSRPQSTTPRIERPIDAARSPLNRPVLRAAFASVRPARAGVPAPSDA